MDRSGAEAIYDSGRKACVKVLLVLANQVERLEGRVERLEGEVRELRRDSGNSSLPPSADPGVGKRPRKGKRSDRNPGAQPGHRGSPGVPLDYVGHGVKRFSGDRDRLGLAGVCGGSCPISCPSAS
jgi:hypothetical protein